MGQARLGERFYQLPTQDLAEHLLGKVIVRRLPGGAELRGIVVEVEAYLSGGDPASHSHRGPGKKNASMFSSPGSLYVYPIHARHCLNVVTEPNGCGAAVLLRGIEPISGVDSMQAYRGFDEKLMSSRDLVQLTRGPGRLCEALAVDRALDGINLCTSRSLWFEQTPRFCREIHWEHCRAQRIGISQAKTRKLRWFVDGNYFVSGCARDHSSGRTWSFMNW